VTLSGEQVQQAVWTQPARSSTSAPGGHARRTFYQPTTGGFERGITERLRHWEQLRSDRAGTNDTTHTDADDSTTSDNT
jgi:hypothetical protein